jgi:hypothetical protein
MPYERCKSPPDFSSFGPRKGQFRCRCALIGRKTKTQGGHTHTHTHIKQIQHIYEAGPYNIRNRGGFGSEKRMRGNAFLPSFPSFLPLFISFLCSLPSFIPFFIYFLPMNVLGSCVPSCLFIFSFPSFLLFFISVLTFSLCSSLPPSLPPSFLPFTC